MNQFIRTIQRYPFQAWALLSNFGVFAWLQTHTSSLVEEGESLVVTHQPLLTTIKSYFNEYPWLFLVLAIGLLILFKFLKNVGKIIFTVLNLALLVKILGLL